MINNLTEDQKQSIFNKVFSNTTEGRYGPVTIKETDFNVIKFIHVVCTDWNFKLVSSSDGQFTGGYSQEIYTANDVEFHLFSFQDGELYEYEKRVKQIKVFSP